ncbi:hypothetical protein SDRG_11048 [Saprolegnia diclina VS20]|uniref:Hook C-terminal domain-containing protein n=1 Tax=Saprolegnia diclina (strain VS20) TaxID=1156394 RepID=T0Q0W0_SAPDV|nr:hypothetical protein SDRG_11048 [Saprolegnia diclina VS20]EQC31449.1 hypothetical protein SDRG_11048 [Saprolegnia diclina VS20]|eukprot:XP_008615290.1 hypothetical protein SDRG_11048 [Saprolegnia diclina VS20]
MMDRTTEQLRSKHVRTLELLQKTLDENAEMKKTLSQKAFPLSMGQGVDLSKRVVELENELERLQRSPAMASDNAKVATLETRVHELEAANYNLEFNLSAKERLVVDATRERDELQAALAANIAKSDARSNQDADALAKALDARANAEGECLRMADTIEKLQKKEWTFTEQIEALRAQKLAFENEHAALYRTLEDKERQMEFVVQELQGARAEVSQLREMSPKCDRTPSIKVEVTPAISQEALDSAMRPTLARNKQLLRDNQQLRDHVESLQAELVQYQSRLSSTTTFAAHIDLKKENFLLRQQVEEMQALQKKFLGTAKKQTFQFNNQRGV